jgi:hypothetical protein
MLSWKEKRAYLIKLIKKLSDLCGGDDLAWLKLYMQDVLDGYAENFDVAIRCFEDLVLATKPMRKEK